MCLFFKIEFESNNVSCWKEHKIDFLIKGSTAQIKKPLKVIMISNYNTFSNFMVGFFRLLLLESRGLNRAPEKRQQPEFKLQHHH